MTPDVSRCADALETIGWCKAPFRLKTVECDALSVLIPNDTPGIRLSPQHVSLPPALMHFVEALGFSPLPLRIVGFNKNADRNWSLPWHQDRAIRPDTREDVPESDLRNMAFAHIALDDSGPGRGGLELLDGSHALGRIDAPKIETLLPKLQISTPDAPRGTILLVKALTVHRSAPLRSGSRRRALRIDFQRNEEL